MCARPAGSFGASAILLGHCAIRALAHNLPHEILNKALAWSDGGNGGLRSANDG